MGEQFNENDPTVPNQDSTHNVQSRDVVGNKTDTSAVPSSTTSLVAITKKIYDEVVSMSDASELFGKSGPSNVEIDDDATYALELYDVGDDVPTTGEITPGNYQIDRIRDAALTNIVASTHASEATGRIYCSEVFSTVAGWSIGDMVLVTFSGGSVVHAGSTTVLPNAYFYSRITREESIETEVAKIPKSDAAITWNGTALQSIQDKAEDALEGENLDHLQAVTTVAADMTAEVVDGSVISRMLSKTSDTSTYTPADASQEMLSDKLGAFTGDGGADQDDSTKASLDLVHTDLDAIIAGTITNATGADVATDVVAAQVVIDAIIGYLEAGGDIHDVLYADAAGASVAADIITIDGLHDVPAKDAVTDAHIRDVVGKKDDTAQTTVGTTRSIIAYVKGLLNQVALIKTKTDKITGTFLNGVIANLNVLTEQDMIPEVAVTTLTDIGKISVDYVGWYADANITGTGATLTIRVYEDDSGGTLREVTNLQEVITEGVSGSGKIKLGALGTIERNYKATVQSSIAPAGGVASNLIKYDYATFDKE